MIRFIVLFFLFTLGLFLHSVKAQDPCLKLFEPIRLATDHFFTNYPYWYNIAVAKKETKCRWIKSFDGHGSIGYFQLTPKFLDPLLKPLFPDYTKEYSKDHFYAFVYYLRTLFDTSPIKKLWIVYQRYNGGNWVIKECRKANSWDWDKCKMFCMRGNVCVWKVQEGCKQYRSACEINYDYSLKIYQFGQLYKKGIDSLAFW